MSAPWWTTIMQSLGGTADQIDLARHCDRLEAVVTDQGHRLDHLQHQVDLGRQLARAVTADQPDRARTLAQQITRQETR